MAVVTPESLPENTIIDFRAPPPSPIASGRRSSVRNENVLSEFLENSLKVPDLVLPDRVFPRQKSIQNPPPQLDLGSLTFLENESNVKLKLIESVARIGCFEVVNHGIPHDLIKSVLVAAGDGIFGIPPEERKLATRCYLDRPFGFEEIHGEDGREITEEFVWSPDERLKADMEGICPMGYSNFSEKMEKLLPGIQDVGKKVLAFLLQQNSIIKTTTRQTDEDHGSYANSICYLHKHSRVVVVTEDLQSVNSLRYDVIRMLIRGSEFPHALCLHVCNGAEEFHVYSKKGWVSFHPNSDSLVITIGDKLQAGSGGQYKHVIGKPIFKGVDDDNPISMAFLYSPPEMKLPGARNQNGLSISISQQIIVGIMFILLYQLIVRIFESL